MIISDLVKRLAELGASSEVIVAAVEAVEIVKEEYERRFPNDRERRLQQRERRLQQKENQLGAPQ